MEIQRVDLSDPATADAWYDVYVRADRFQRPFAEPWLRPEIPEQYAPNLRRDASAHAGFVDGRLVAAGTIGLPLLDNTHSAALGVYVAPPDRRRGYGAALLAHLEDIARGHGRRTTYLEAHYPLQSPVDGAGSGSADFATSQGYAFGLGDIMRSLSLPVDEERLASQSRDAAEHHQGYRLEVFGGPVPEEWVADYVALEASVATDAPSGALEVEAGSTEIEPFREGEARLARQGRLTYSAVALQGRDVAGFSTVTVALSDRTHAYQWGTMVSRLHRGHRLGLALKAANLQQLQVHEPKLRSITTFNAEANGPMISVNDQLGYVPVERFGEFEKRW